MSKRSLITVRMWTEHFLGTAEKAEAFLALLRTLENGRWTPDKWNNFEPIKNRFRDDCDHEVVREWTEERHGRVSNGMLFRKAKPYLLFNVNSWRGRVPDLNWLWFDVDSTEFSKDDGTERLKHLIAQFIAWSGAAYATASHSGQRHTRFARGNPTSRLDAVGWLTYFGAPYVRLLGKDHIQSCSVYKSEQFADGYLLTAASRPDCPSLTLSDELLLNIERSLGAEIFASDTSEKARIVPLFNLSQTVNGG